MLIAPWLHVAVEILKTDNALQFLSSTAILNVSVCIHLRVCCFFCVRVYVCASVCEGEKQTERKMNGQPENRNTARHTADILSVSLWLSGCIYSKWPDNGLLTRDMIFINFWLESSTVNPLGDPCLYYAKTGDWFVKAMVWIASIPPPHPTPTTTTPCLPRPCRLLSTFCCCFFPFKYLSE